MTGLKITLLGTFRVVCNKRPILSLQSDKTRALLAFLAVENQRPKRRERLAGMLWPDLPEQRARHNLSQSVYLLRRELGDHNPGASQVGSQPEKLQPHLLVHPKTVQLNPRGDQWVDVVAFDRLIATAENHTHLDPVDCAFCRVQFEQAERLYAGDFLADFSVPDSQIFSEWVLVQREQLHQRAIRLLTQLVDCHSAQGAYASALVYARRQVELDPLRESSHRQLIQLLAKTGQRSQALAHYEAFSQLLETELGISPERETIQVVEEIRGWGKAQASQSIDTRTFPTALTIFVGRKKELAEIQARLSEPDCRLLTLVGPGGSGKTRLALELLRKGQLTFADGCYFVPLGARDSEEAILAAIAEAVGFVRDENRDFKEQLFGFLRRKHLLLLLDSFEHLTRWSSLLVEILQKAPQVKFLITSRVRLELRGGYHFPVLGLEYPKREVTDKIEQFEAVGLFSQVSHRAHPAFELDDTNIHAIAEICRLVDGLPLSILLAAAWSGTLTPAEILEEIRTGLDSLVVDWADLPARQHSLRAVFDQSWNLLSSPEQSALSALSVFRGGAFREGASVVAGASDKILRALSHSYFLHRDEQGRFSMHALLEQYAAEMLALDPAREHRVRARHAAFYARKARAWKEALRGAGQRQALEEIEAEVSNLQAAWEWAITQRQREMLNDSLDGLCIFCWLRGRYHLGVESCLQVLEAFDTPQVSDQIQELLIQSTAWASHFSRLLGDLDEAGRLLEICERRLRTLEDSGASMTQLQAMLDFETGSQSFHRDRARSRMYLEQAERQFQSAGERWWQVSVLNSLADLALLMSDFTAGVGFARKALGIGRQIGDLRGQAHAMNELGLHLTRQARLEEGKTYLLESIELLQEIGDQAGVAHGYLGLARYYFWFGYYEEGQRYCEASIPAYQELGYLHEWAFATSSLTIGRIFSGRYDEAVRQGIKGRDLALELGFEREYALALSQWGGAESAQGRYAQALELLLESERAYRAIEHPEELAWLQGILGYTVYRMGDLKRAWGYVLQALESGIRLQSMIAMVVTLPVVALFLAEQGDLESALALYTTAAQNSMVANSIWLDDIAGQPIARMTAQLPAEVREEARARGKAVDLFTAARQILDSRNKDSRTGSSSGSSAPA